MTAAQITPKTSQMPTIAPQFGSKMNMKQNFFRPAPASVNAMYGFNRPQVSERQKQTALNMIPINKSANVRTTADSNTKLNSHFSSITTQIKNKDTLMKALNDLKINAKVADTEGGKIEARGHKGDTIMADVVIP